MEYCCIYVELFLYLHHEIQDKSIRKEGEGLL